MADDYGKVKGGRLKLKGGKSLKSKITGMKRKAEKVEPEQDPLVVAAQQDESDHAGWWIVDSAREVRGGAIAIEVTPHCYIRSLDDGHLTIGAPHTSGEGPAPDEVFTLIRPPDSERLCVAIKSGYGRYLGIDDGSISLIVGRAEAVGTRQRWEIVFDDSSRSALQCLSSGKFVSADLDEEGHLHANKPVAGESEIVKLRTNTERFKEVDYTPDEDKLGAVADTEVAYVKKFQSFEDRKLRVSAAPKVDLKRARVDGTLHGSLLDRREKMKSDRYCK